MADAIILILVAILMGLAVKGAVKHFKGDGTCCGCGTGAAAPAGKTHCCRPQGGKTMKISGMHCARCAENVKKAIEGIDGVSAKVSLEDGSAVVSCDRPLDCEKLKKAVEKAGFKVTSIDG